MKHCNTVERAVEDVQEKWIEDRAKTSNQTSRGLPARGIINCWEISAQRSKSSPSRSEAGWESVPHKKTT